MSISRSSVGDGWNRFLMFALCSGLLTSLVAGQTPIYDFVAQASSASWQSSGGSVAWGAGFDAARGQVTGGSSTLEDGVWAARIFSHPPTTGQNRWIEGTFSNIAVPLSANAVRFEASVGYLSGASTSTGLNFSVLIQRGSEFFELSALEAVYDTRLNALSADLTAYKGQSITMKLRVDPGVDSNFDWGCWKAAQIVDDATTVFDFVAGADDGSPSVFWYNGSSQPIPWGAAPSSVGGALYTSAVAEDGLIYPNAMHTVPNLAGGGVYLACGQFNGVNLPATHQRLKFVARVGFLGAAATTNGVTFELFVKLNTWSAPQLIGTLAATKDGRLDWFSVDFTPYQGQANTTIYLRANGGVTPVDDLAIWTEARIVGYSPRVAYDFTADAGRGAWSSGHAVPPGNMLSMPTNAPNPSGVCQIETNTLEDGAAYLHLFTHPNYNQNAPMYYIQARFDNVIIPNNWTNVRFSAQVGLRAGAQLSDGVVFRVLVIRRGKTDTLCELTKSYTGSLGTITGNLSGYQGENISIVLYVDAKASPNWDFAAWVSPRITAELPTQVYGVDAGVDVDNGSDDIGALEKAVALARAASPCEVLLSSGTHNLSRPLTISGAVNLSLRGNVGSPTTFMMSDPRAGSIFIQTSRNVATRNLVIDYGPTLASVPFTQGVISSVNASAKQFTFTIDPGYMQLNDAFFGDPDASIYWGTFHAAAAPHRQPNNTVDFNQITAKVQLSPGVWRLTVDRLNGAANGMRYMYHRRGGHQVQAHNSLVDGQFIFDNITQYAGPAVCFVGTMVEKIYVRNCNVRFKPSSGRIKTTNADGVHVQNCVYGPDVVDSVFEGMSDDGVNAYGIGYKIMEADSAKTRLSVYTQGRPLFPGDRLRLFRPSSGTLGSTVAVVAILGDKLVQFPAPLGSFLCKDVQVDQVPIADLQVGVDSDRFFSVDYGSKGFLVTGCTFRDYRGRGVLGDATDGMITNNTFQNLNSHAIWCNNGTYFNEGLQCSNLVVDGNTISYCGTDFHFNQSNYSGVISVAGVRTDDSPSASILHSNIRITNNTVTNWPRHAIYIASSSAVTISGNVLTNTTSGTKATSGRRGTMMFNNVQSVTVTGNTVSDGRAASAITGKLFLFSNSNGQLTTAGNSYNPNVGGSEIQIVQSY